MANERFFAGRSEESNLLDRIIANASYARRASHLRFVALSENERFRVEHTYHSKDRGFDRGHLGVLLRPCGPWIQCALESNS